MPEKRDLQAHCSLIYFERSEILRASRIRYTSPHPKDMVKMLWKQWRKPKVSVNVYISLSNPVVIEYSKNARGYTAERYLSKLSQARAIIPDLAVTTDIIVGFQERQTRF